MSEDYITRKEHEEFRQTMLMANENLDAENKRQNERIKELERAVNETRTLTASVERLAVNMENMLKEQEKQGKRLEALEGRDGEMWRKVTGYIVTAIVGIVIGYIFTQIGM